MNPPTDTYRRHSRTGEPVWEIAEVLFPRQGEWTEADYLALDTNRLIEFVDGSLEFLPMPTLQHQWIVQFLYRMLFDALAPAGGLVFVAPMPLLVRAGLYREPDLVALLPGTADTVGDRRLESADLVIEVVSPGAANRDRDAREKRAEYEAAGISEFWLVDPHADTIEVLALADATYRTVSLWQAGETATSATIPDFSVAVTTDVFNARG